MTRDGRIFTIVRNGNEIRVLTNIGNDIRVEVVSDSVDSEMLLGLAEEISRDTSRNQ